jgi:hypothetical protein
VPQAGIASCVSCASGNFTQFVEARLSFIVALELRYLETAICPGAKDAIC